MINPAETIRPTDVVIPRINAAETVPPATSGDGTPVSSSFKNTVLLAGESVSDSYVIHSLMEKQGKQSNVYLAKKWGKTYVIKVYKDGWKPSGQMQSFLTNVRHPNIANIIDSGFKDDNYYEIYEYYSEGTLEERKAIPITKIQEVIVPSINEGLHELHRNNIVHCDIKPSNLFYADNESKIVIGDCGISGYTNSNGKLVDSVRGTPEYAPRVRALLWSAAMSPAYDYGSFGLVLCRLVLGHSLFEGMSVEEISLAWERGLEFPSQISGRIGVLIKGLLNEDEDTRWGYNQVKRWCEGEYINSDNRSLYGGVKKTANVIKPMVFGRFNDQIVTVESMHQLVKAIKTHWDQATKVIKRNELVDFVRQFDKDTANKIKEFAMYQDIDAAVYRFLLLIDDEDPQMIFYGGKKYDDLSAYVDSMAKGNDETAIRFLSSGMLVEYLKKNEYDRAQVDKLEQLINRVGSRDMSSILTVCYALKGKKDFDLKGREITSLEDLVVMLSGCSIEEIDRMLDNDSFIAWFSNKGYERIARRLKEMGR